MTGIEQLRKLGADAVRGGEVGRAICDIADQIERERECERDTIENLRLELGEARDEAAWVRERGGLETVEARLMPEGCEWPRYESGDLVMFGDCVENRNGTCTVNSVRFYSGGGVSVYGEGRGAQFVVVTEPVMRDPIRKARPKVLAADGEPLEVGQTVWDTNGDELVIGALEDGGHTVACRYADVGDGIPVHGMWSPSDLTHQHPVLDADGVPIKVGDTVWDTDAESDTPLTVVDVSSDLVRCEYTWKDGKTYRPCYPPSVLTHTKPERDSWERIEEDAEKDPCDYFGFDGEETCGKCPASGKNCEQTMALDLVRRAKALAERDA